MRWVSDAAKSCDSAACLQDSKRGRPREEMPDIVPGPLIISCEGSRQSGCRGGLLERPDELDRKNAETKQDKAGIEWMTSASCPLPLCMYA